VQSARDRKDLRGASDALVCATAHQLERFTWSGDGESGEDEDGDDRPLKEHGRLGDAPS
jgi:hypothetical protein